MNGNKKGVMMLIGSKEFVDTVLIEKPFNFNSGIFSRKNIHQFTLLIPFPILTLAFRTFLKKFNANLRGSSKSQDSLKL